MLELLLTADDATVRTAVLATVRLAAVLFVIGYAAPSLARAVPKAGSRWLGARATYAMCAVPAVQAAHYAAVWWRHSVSGVEDLAVRPASALLTGGLVWLLMMVCALAAARHPVARAVRAERWSAHLLLVVFTFAYLPRISEHSFYTIAPAVAAVALFLRVRFPEPAPLAAGAGAR